MSPRAAPESRKRHSLRSSDQTIRYLTYGQKPTSKSLYASFFEYLIGKNPNHVRKAGRPSKILKVPSSHKCEHLPE